MIKLLYMCLVLIYSIFVDRCKDFAWRYDKWSLREFTVCLLFPLLLFAFEFARVETFFMTLLVVNVMSVTVVWL